MFRRLIVTAGCIAFCGCGGTEDAPTKTVDLKFTINGEEMEDRKGTKEFNFEAIFASDVNENASQETFKAIRDERTAAVKELCGVVDGGNKLEFVAYMPAFILGDEIRRPAKMIVTLRVPETFDENSLYKKIESLSFVASVTHD